MADIVADNLTVNQALTQTDVNSDNSLAGWLGVGTSQPASPLHVMFSDAGVSPGERYADAAIFESNGNAYLQIIGGDTGERSINFASPTNGADGAIKYNHGSVQQGFQFVVNNNSNVAMVIDSSGRVGVGTTTPGSQMEIDGADTVLRIRNVNDGGGTFLGETYSCLQMGLYNPAGTSFGVVPPNTARSFLGIDCTGKVGTLTNSYGNPSWRNILDDGNGRVGIGTVSPLDKLHVEGANPGLAMRNMYDSVTQGLYRLVCGGTSMQMRQNNAPAGDFSSESVLMTWRDGGNVGIRTNDPATTLHVRGSRVRLEADDASRRIDLRTDGDGLDLQGVGAPLYINAGTSENTYMNTDGGRVGIGDRWPEAKLHVFGDAKVSNSLTAGKLWCGTRKVADVNGCYYA